MPDITLLKASAYEALQTQISNGIAAEQVERALGDGRLSLALRDAGVLPLTNVGGTGDAITADLTPAILNNGITAPAGLSKLEYIPIATNPNDNPTLTIGGATYGIRGADGGTWPAGGFVIGRSYTLRRRNTILRVVAGDGTATDLANARAERIIADAQMGSPMLTSVAGTGNAVTAAVPSILQDAGIVAANLRAVALIWPADAAAGTVTLNIDGRGAVEVRTADNAVPPAQMLRGGHLVSLVKDGPRWRVVSPELRIADLQAESAARAADIAALTTGIADVASRIDEPSETVQTEDVRWIAWDDQGQAMLGWSGSGLRVRLDDWTVGDVAPRVLSDPGIEVVQQTDDTLDGRVLARDAAGNALWMWRAGDGGGFDGIMSQAFWDRGREALNLQAQQLSTTAIQICGVNGQSLTVGGTYSSEFSYAYASSLMSEGCLQIDGLARGDGIDIGDTLGPRRQGYSTSTPGTGLELGRPGAGANGLPFSVFSMLNAHRADAGVPLVPVVTSGHGISGIPIEQMDDDPNTGANADTIVWDNFTYWTAQAKAVSEAAGRTILPGWHVISHGTSAQNMPRHAYANAWWGLQQDSLDYLRSIGLPLPRYIITQPGGNANITSQPWAVCDDILDICEQGGAILGTAEYWYPIADNNVHPDAYWTAILGETMAWGIAEVEAGRRWTITRPKVLSNAGGVLTLHFDSLRDDEVLEIEAASKYGGQGIDAHLGFQLTGGAITASTVRGHVVVLHYTGAPTAVRYAMQSQVVTGIPGNRYTAHRGLLRTSLTKPAKSVPDQRLLVRPVPSFTLNL